MAAIASSSSAVAAVAFHPKRYDVFISFRGEDTRRNFTSHLVYALRQKQIQIYIDDKLNRGDEISPALFKAIEDSHISVIVFSENYASSKWCLDELIKTLECRNKGLLVIPVFYNVDPSHVRKQRESYEKAFAKHERDFNVNEDKLKEWKEALFVAANIAGWDSQNYGDESELIHMIVEDVLQKLEYKDPQRESECSFSINDNHTPFESLLREAQTIGIWGMDGIGNAIIAKWLFEKYSSQFEGSCFLPNIRENLEKNGQALYDLCNVLVSKLLDEDERITNVESTTVKRRLYHKRVFVVLDDVSTSKQLEYLLGELQYRGSGSRIIITTRDKHVLTKGRVDAIHEVKVHDLIQEMDWQTDCPESKYLRKRSRLWDYEDVYKVSKDEKARREKIRERMQIILDLVPGCNKVTGKALALDETINYIQSLQRQVEFLSMKLVAVNLRVNSGIEAFPPKDQTSDPAGMPFSRQATREYSRGSSREWLHLQ